MNQKMAVLSSGLPGLDQMLQGIWAGDNVVWEVDAIEDYKPFLAPYCAEARRRQRRLIYFRFARHEALLGPDSGAEIHELEAAEGFEKFLTGILDVIESAGPGAYYVFDCLSDLAADWFSDRMLGNFFMITCPFLFKLETVTYFALLKGQHSFHATDGINNTAQVILEVYRKKDQLFIHPLKVWERYSPTLYMLHSWEEDEFRPVTSSATITDILGSVPQPWLEFTIHRPGVWTRTFRHAQETLDGFHNGTVSAAEVELVFNQLLKMVVTREERFLGLAEQYFTLADLIEIMKRMIGTGLIGGKSLGMLLARAVLKKSSSRWEDLLEGHDSFFIGSDVFYNYLVQNGCWWLRRRQKDFNVFLEQAEVARKKMLTGTFPTDIQDQFMEMLEYFGQSPIIVRSSSLLEDNYGNAFSGKYESVFCANQGSPAQRLEAFIAAVRTVYASTMSPEGLLYRQHHRLLDRDEQMALLVQRVSGEMYGSNFFPQVAGVGFSFNPFVWHEDIDPQAGFLRLVFGLGTRAVDRTGDDYTRLVALNAPQKRLETKAENIRQYSQKRVDILDLRANELVTRDFESVAKSLPPGMMLMFATPDEEMAAQFKAMKREGFTWVLSFERLLSEINFAADMREALHELQAAYQNPVDVEFTVNFFADDRYRINLVQCRPFQVKVQGEGSRVKFPTEVPGDQTVFASHGPIVGQSLATHVDRLIYVVPAIYGKMSLTHRYSVARTVGRLTHLDEGPLKKNIMLVGPGRWGTSMPQLGVPVTFAEINTVSILCEIALMHEGLIPDVSLGTHFFNDLVEMDMLYLAISPGKEGHILNEALIQHAPNQLTQLLPNAEAWTDAIKVIDTTVTRTNQLLYLNVDSMKQMAICYLTNETAAS